jgi:hypothetical protein
MLLTPMPMVLAKWFGTATVNHVLVTRGFFVGSLPVLNLRVA